MILENVIFTKSSWLIALKHTWIVPIIPQRLELLKNNIIILFNNHLALFDQLCRIWPYNLTYVQLEELKHVLERFNKIMKIEAEFIDEEGFNYLVVK